MSVKNAFICSKVSLFLICMLFFQHVKAQPDFSEVGKKMDEAKIKLGGNAILLVYKDGKTVYQKILGDMTVKTQAPIAACSQWLTAALVMSFIDQGKLSLDDKVSRYLPIFSKYAKGYITIRDCLSHFTGIESDKISQSSFEPSKKFISLDEEVEYFASKREIQANPGVEFRYNNTGLNIAARVLEVIAKRGYEQLIQDKIIRPLMMRNSNFSSLNAVNPSGGGISTANDYLNFLSMLLNKGMFNGKRILSEQSIAEMEKIRTTRSLIKYTPKITEGLNFGFGAWITGTDEKGNATQLACPGIYGPWAMVDKCRGYGFILLTKELVPIDSKEIYQGIQQAIDDQIASVCK